MFTVKCLALIPAVLLLVACGGVKSGTVVEKDHRSAWVQITIVNKFPHQIHHPECWELTLDDGTDTGDVCVDRAAWESLSVGDHYEEGP